MFLLQKIQHHKLVLGIILAWTLFASFFVIETKNDAYTHDFIAHVEYTQIISREKRLPAPHEKWETYQPPLYYLIASLVFPNSANHIRMIRLLSVFYGAVVLGILAYQMDQFAYSSTLQAIVLLFISTTPKFLFVFSGYNNDSLATFFSVVLITLTWSLLKQWKWKYALGLAFCAIAGIYTKYSVAFAMATAGLLAIVWYKRGLLSEMITARILLIFIAGLTLLLPWLYLHNYQRCKEWNPTNAGNLNGALRLVSTPLQTIVTPPGFSHREWIDPYTHQFQNRNEGTKKTSYWAYLFVSSIWGEYEFPFLPAFLLWTLVWLHLYFYVASFRNAFKTPQTILAGATLAFGLAPHMLSLMVVPFGCTMDYRYVAWLWMPLSILYAHFFKTSPVSHWRIHRPPWFIFQADGYTRVWIAVLCIGCQLYFIASLFKYNAQ